MTIRINHNKSTALERSVINYFGVCVGGGGLNRFYVIITLAMGSAVVHKQGIREGLNVFRPEPSLSPDPTSQLKEYQSC